eukprot:1160717-Pelagomonas_calceolata.AAC.14
MKGCLATSSVTCLAGIGLTLLAVYIDMDIPSVSWGLRMGGCLEVWEPFCGSNLPPVKGLF